MMRLRKRYALPRWPRARGKLEGLALGYAVSGAMVKNL